MPVTSINYNTPPPEYTPIGISQWIQGVVFSANDGSEALPGLSFANETSTGFWRESNGVVGLSLSGSELLRFSSTGIDFDTGTYRAELVVSPQTVGNVSFTIPDLGGVSDTVVLEAATQTLSNKTFTTPTFASPTITGTPDASAAVWSDLGQVLTADIDGGTLDSVVVGGAAAAAGTFTTLTWTTAVGNITESQISDLGTTVAMVADDLSVFAATTSAELAGVISDETGTGALVFANTPTLVTPVIGVATATSLYSSSHITVGPNDDNTFVVSGATITAGLSVHTDNTADLAGISNERHSTTAAFGAHVYLARSRGTHGSEATVASGDYLSRIMSAGHDGTDYEVTAEIRAVANGTIADGQVPTDLVLLTSATNTAGLATALTLSSDQTATFTGAVFGPNGAVGVPTYSFSNDTDTGLYLATAGELDVAVAGTNIISMTSTLMQIHDAVEIDHVATSTDDHTLELITDADGFGDVKSLDMVYTTGAIAIGADESVILVNIDESAATGGDISALEVLATEGSASMFGLFAGALVNPIEQLSGSFADMDSAVYTTSGGGEVDCLADFISTGSDVTLFTADNDYVTIGNTAKFEEIEFLLATGASGAGVKPTLEYSTAGDTWATFSPTDGTNGIRNTGVIAWLDGDIPSWATHTGGEYKIRITRTANGLSIPPVEDKVQIAVTSEFSWDNQGDLTINDIAGVDASFTGTLTVGSITNDMSVFAATTSAQLAGVISDETGSGSLVFGTSPTLITPALGTPSALVGTNITGTAAGLTAGNVTTNANLTGHVTSVGNAAVLGSFSLAQLNTAINDGTVDPAGTDNSTDVTLTGTPNYITIAGQVITVGQIDLATDVTGELPETDGGTGLSAYTTGDILYASGTNTLTRLAVGSNTDVLTLAGGVPTWATAGTPGAHATSHQDGGADEISVTGLSGLLADDQHVLDAEVISAVEAGTLSTVDINGGTINGITDLAVVDGGTGSSTASGARSNLGLEIGVDVIAFDNSLNTIASITPTADNFIVGNGVGSAWEGKTPAQARTSMGVAIGSDVQAYDAGLASIAGLTTAADRLIYTTALDTYNTATFTAAARTLLAETSAANQRTTMGVAIGSDVQAHSSVLDAVAAGTDLTVAQGGTGVSTLTDHGVVLGSGTGAVSVTGAGTSGQVLTSNGAVADPTFQDAAGAGGLDEADQWRLHTDFSGDSVPIASNLERVDTQGFGKLGTGMTESSGIFTFPSTGYWLVSFGVRIDADSAADLSAYFGIQTTTNNSTYDWATIPYTSLYATNAQSSGYTQFLFDVTSTTTHKVRFSVGDLGSNDVKGSTTANVTYMTFLRLGDT